MSKIEVVLNSNGIRDLLKSNEIQSLLSEHARAISGNSGGETEVYVAETRAVAHVYGNNKNNKLLKGIRK